MPATRCTCPTNSCTALVEPFAGRASSLWTAQTRYRPRWRFLCRCDSRIARRQRRCARLDNCLSRGRSCGRSAPLGFLYRYQRRCLPAGIGTSGDSARPIGHCAHTPHNRCALGGRTIAAMPGHRFGRVVPASTGGIGIAAPATRGRKWARARSAHSRPGGRPIELCRQPGSYRTALRKRHDSAFAHHRNEIARSQWRLPWPWHR